MTMIIAFISGLIMSMGLIISGMVNPPKVIGFLDIFGRFDLTLGFVMMGALLVTAIGYRMAKRYHKPVCADCFDDPKFKKIDARLFWGSAIFGVGWGLAGFCPAPAVVGIGLGIPKVSLFVVSMIIGMALAKKIIALQAK